MLLIVLCLPFSPVWAEDGDQLLRRQWQEMQNVQNMQEQNRRSDTLQARVPMEEDEGIPLFPIQTGVECLPWQRVAVRGLDDLTAARQHTVQAATPSTCVNGEKLNQLSRTITEMFLQQGYFRIALQQEENGDELIWTVQPARVEEIRNTTGLNTGNLFPHMAGNAVNIHDIDQGLDQANRLTGHRLGVDLYPINAERVAVELSDQTQGDIHVLAGTNNRGSESTGKTQAYTRAEVDNPLGFADVLSVYANTTPSTGGGTYSRSGSLYYSVPYGYWTFSVYGGASAYARSLQLPHSVLDTDGRFWQAGLMAERVFSRGNRHISSLYGQLGRSSTLNRIGGYTMDVSSSEQSVAALGMNQTLLIPDGVLNANLEYKQSLPILGADDANIAGKQNTDFKKLSASLDWSHRHKIGTQEMMLNHTLVGQYAPDDLPSIEAMGLSDASAVRGFRDGGITGDSGMYLRQTLSSVWHTPYADINPYLGMDIGTVRYHHLPSRSALGGIAGVKFGKKQWQADISVGQGRKLNAADNDPNKHSPVQWWFDAQWRF